MTIGSRAFSLFQKLGYHITPNHFHYPIPDTTKLKDDLWSKHSELVGININESKQLELLSLFEASFKNEYENFPRRRPDKPYDFYLGNGAFESVDAEVLYCMIRHFKPRRIYEIGSGFTTYLSAQAVLKNAKEDSGYQCELLAIEPYPNKTLKAGFPGLSRLIPEEVQAVPLTEFMKFSANDILFIDSSHVLKIGNDVQYEYLEILPRLNKGVLIHVHDIFLPQEYPKKWVKELHLFWTEQYLLQAFLAFNDSLEVLWAGSYMHLKHPDKLARAFSSYNREETLPGSFWFRRMRNRMSFRK
jgi:hypothetical protein